MTTDRNHIRIILTANAGVILRANEYTVLVDALHDWKTQSFSCVSKATLAAVKNMFSDKEPDVVLVTHRHPDHCSELLLQSFLCKWGQTALLFPEMFPEQFSERYVGNIKIESLSLPHDGDGFENVIQRGYCITMGKVRFLLAGDCAMAAQDRLLNLTQGHAVDFAIMNFPWITLPGKCDFLKEHLKPTHIIAVHLPFASDDISCFRSAAFAAAETEENIHILSEPMQTLYFP